MKKLSIGVLGCVAAAAALLFLLRSSDQEKIEKILEECARAAERGDADRLLQHVSPTCRLADGDSSAVATRVRKELREPGRVGALELTSMISVEGEEADAKVHVRSRLMQNVLGETDFKLKLKKEGGEWKIVYVEEVR
jgi:hypothetical protein